MLQTLEKIEPKQPTYQDRDRYRLENLPDCLNIVKKGSEYLGIEALEQIEKILVRVHNTHAIAWDFGGVLMDGHNKFFIELYARSHGIDLSKEQLIKLWEIIFKSDPIPGVNYDALKIGRATPEQFARHAIEHFNLVFAEVGKEPVDITNKEIQNFLTLYYSHYDPKHENREVLQCLHKLGIRQYGLTNNFMAKIEYFLEQHEFDYLQWLIMLVSEKFGASKPDPRIYLSFKQHVFLDLFAKEALQVNLPNDAIEQLWEAIFGEEAEVPNFVAYEQKQISREQLSQYAIAQYNWVLKKLGYTPVDATLFASRFLEFWTQQYDRIAEQTIFVDDKIKNLNQAFECEGILGVHYDANQGQKLIDRPVIRELLEQEQLKQVVRTLRELTVHQNALSQRAKQVLDRLMPFRIRHEKLLWQAHMQKHRQIVDALSNEQIYALLQQHYKQLYTTHFQLGQLVERQYTLVHRLASLPEYTYDEARQIVLELFETSDLFLDQNRDLYPWQETEIPRMIATDLGDIQESESLLKKKLLPEIKRTIVDYINLLDVSHQPVIQELIERLQTQANDIETLKQLTEQLLQQLAVLNSIRVVPWQQIEQLFENFREMLVPIEEKWLDLQEMRSFVSRQLDRWYRQIEQEARRTSMDLVPLQRTIADWEQNIHQLESTYFEQYRRWQILKEREIVALYKDAILDEVRDRFSCEELYQFIRGLMLRVYDLPRWKDLTKPTVILISGTSGSGKSTLSTHLAQSCGIQKVFSTDETGRANTKAILDFLFGHQEAAKAFPALYQSSFQGSMESYYYQAIVTAIGVEGLAKRLHKQNTSALIEGVGLMPGILSEEVFERLNIDWLILQVDRQQHCQHFARRAQTATLRNAKRYREHFEMIRQIQEQLVEMGLKHELTIVENSSSIQQTVRMATERIKSPLTTQFVEVRDPIREQMSELLAMQRQHLPIAIRFDVKRAALNLGVLESQVVELLHRFGFEEVPNRRHQWMRRVIPANLG
ncbi:2-phosphoglycerate kinase [Pleurocapsa sp. PCC 7327]|uniref:HAD family hydrolase n=1 Tax=Pleurocapsa sp. PCC 7327 TaxID=118163 RepID=UPI00029FF352|nr:HAD family hydrolase [Pleurocapsa sp. PCC 7327]AFY75515.1 2-phosphoglycerate kinase [Pleurocapsa sp. PCC 7327]